MKPTLGQLWRLVGNPSAYAVQRPDGSWFPVRELITTAVLGEHLQERQTVGTYIGHAVEEYYDTTKLTTVARTLVFDLDDNNEEHAHDIVHALRELGIPDPNIGVEFSGKKGYHVWLPLQEYRPNTELRRLGRAALALARAMSATLSPATEVFPKQDEVRDLGNLVKLPGGIHQVSGKQNNFITEFPLALSTMRWERALAALPEEVQARRAVSDTRFPCLESIQEGVKEGGRNVQLFHLATMIRRAGVNDENTELVVRRANDLGDPLEEEELATLLENSKAAGPLCTQLPDDVQCGELCIKHRMQGLYTRPGQLRFASAGEHVVVELTSHEGNVVTLDHPDVTKMKASLTPRKKRDGD